MRQGRYSRGKDDWGGQPSRSTERSTAIAEEERDPSKRPPGRKDKDYCKPGHGPHAPVMVRPSWCANKRCQWRLSWKHRTRSWVPEWLCLHQEECGACGKVFCVVVSGGDCPDRHPISPEQQRALDEEIARRAEVRKQYESRKPMVTGQQGYRRKKADW